MMLDSHYLLCSLTTYLHNSMQLNKVGGTLRDRAFYIAFFCLCVSRSLEGIAFVNPLSSYFFTIGRCFQIVSLALLLCLFILGLSGKEPRFIAMRLTLLALFCITGICSRSYYVVWAYLCVSAKEDADLCRVARMVFLINFITILAAAACDYFGFAQPPVVVRGEEVRESFGFTHPNRLGQSILACSMSYLYLTVHARNGLLKIAVLLPGILLAHLADSRTTVLGILAFYVASCMCNGFVKRHAVGMVRAALVLLAFSSVFWIGSLLLFQSGGTFLGAIDRVLSGRLFYPSELMKYVDWGPLGANVYSSFCRVPDWLLVNGEVPIDNAFIKVWLSYGPIVYVVIIFILLGLISRGSFMEQEDQIPLIFMFVCLMLGASESYILDITFCYFMLLIGGSGIPHLPSGSKATQ